MSTHGLFRATFENRHDEDLIGWGHQHRGCRRKHRLPRIFFEFWIRWFNPIDCSLLSSIPIVGVRDDILIVPVRDQPTVPASLKLPGPSLFFNCKIIGHVTCSDELVREFPNIFVAVWFAMLVFACRDAVLTVTRWFFISNNGFPVLPLIKLFKIKKI